MKRPVPSAATEGLRWVAVVNVLTWKSFPIGVPEESKSRAWIELLLASLPDEPSLRRRHGGSRASRSPVRYRNKVKDGLGNGWLSRS